MHVTNSMGTGHMSVYTRRQGSHAEGKLLTWTMMLSGNEQAHYWNKGMRHHFRVMICMVATMLNRLLQVAGWLCMLEQTVH